MVRGLSRRGFFHLAASSVILLCLQSCQAYEEPYLTNVKEVRIHEANINRISISATLEIYNPNKVSLDLSRTELSITSDGKELALIDQTHRVEMPGAEHFDFPISLDIDVKQIFDGDVFGALAFGNQILQNRYLDIEIKGYLYAGKDAIQLKVPIDRKEKVSF